MKAPITFAIAGFGDRGSTYASMQKLFPDRMKVVAVADINPEKVQKAKELYGIKDELCFTSAEEMLAQDKLADVMVVSTMDRQHVNHAIPALEKGYNILMEKPISPDLQECKRIIEVAKHCPGKIIVCHVLRYTTFYNTLKSILDSKKIGDVVSVCANENVGYWHQAHSFVRGNWRNSDQTSPMILQKCCHDMDIYTWLLGKKCKAISSVGDTHLFKKECAPEGATPYCLGGCKAKENCKFDAEKIYITNPATGIRNGNTWMAGVACGVNPTEERTYEALKNGQYGRCVYMCDNNVVDHQQTNLLFEDGTTMSFTMCAFTEKCYRYFKAMGTNGEIEADMLSNKIHVRVFGEPEEIIDVKLLANDLKGHGGGDSGIVNDFLDMLINETEATEQQAVELWEKVNRPNAMIKIPATLEGLPAITATLAKGISVNVTLIFSLERYEQVIDAFIEGIAQADANGHDLKHIGSVASFFVSRVDTAVDNKLEEIGSDEAKALEGKAAIANARLAYELFENKFANDPRWAALEAKGAKKQRPLWASTGTKNPAYSDCVYVDELVAPLIVNTMPEKTLNALADHGNGAPTIKGTYEESHAIMAKLAELGIDFKAVTDKLEADGVASFIKSWDSVLTDVQAGIDRVNG